MKGFYICGPNGSYLDLQDGRYADTVGGYTSESVDSHEALRLLEAEATEWETEPQTGDWSFNQMQEYVGL